MKAKSILAFFSRNSTPAILLCVVVVMAAAIFVFARSTFPSPLNVELPTLPTSISSSMSTQPKIAWSQSEINVILSPGQSTSNEITFASSLPLTNVSVQAAQEIARFLSIEPNIFSTVLPKQPQSVRITFTVSSATAIGTYEGTLRIRNGSQTLPQNVKIRIHVAYQTYSDVGLGFRFNYPQGLFPITSPESPGGVFIQSTDKEILLGGGALPVGKSADEYVTDGFVITIGSTDYAKPLSVNQWLQDFHPYSELDSVSTTTVAGEPALKITLKEEILAGSPVVVFTHNGKLFGISYSSTFQPGSSQDADGLRAYQTVLESFQFN